MEVDAVEDDGDGSEGAVVVEGLDVGELTAVERADADDEQGQVDDAAGDGGVGEDAYGHGVGEYVVVAAAQGGEELVEAGAAEEFDGVGGHDARGNDVGLSVAADDDVVGGDGVVEEVVGEAGAVVAQAGAVSEGALADVHVDQEHLLACGHEGVGDVGDGEGLAGALAQRGGHDDLGLAAGGAAHHVHVGDDHAECVVGDALHHRLAVLEGLAGAQQGPLAVEAAVEGHLAQEGDGYGVLDVAAAAHAGVHEGREQDDDGGEEEAGEEAQEHDAPAVGRYEGAAAVGAFDHAGVVVGHGLGEGVLLAAVEQEEVERLLDLLLALDREDLALLAGDGCDARLGGALVAAGVATLDFDGHDDVVDAAQDVGAELGQGRRKFLDDGVGLGALVLEAVALELDGVVLRDLALDGLVVDAEVGGNEVVGPGGVGEVFLDEHGDAQLGVVLEGVGAVPGRLAHVARGHGADVDDLVVAAVRLELVLDAAELAADDLEALVDEVGGVDGYLVLVVDGLFVVDLDDGVEQGYVELGGSGGDGDVDDGAVLLLLADAEVGGDAVDGGDLGLLDYVDGLAEPGGRHVGGGADGDEAAADGVDLAVGQGGGALVAAAVADDQAGGGGVEGHQGEGHRLAGLHVGEGDLDGCAAVDVDVAQAGAGGVDHVGAGAGHDFLEQPLRLQLQDLVGDVDAVDGVLVALEAAGRGLVGRVLDDHFGLGVVDQGRGGRAVPRESEAHDQGEHVPGPLRQQVEEDVGEVGAFRLGCFVVS